jgi:pyridoxal phosphate enzyme (YggS family)
MLPDGQIRLAENLAAVRSRMAAAAQRARRNPSDVQLIAVTKYVDEQLTAALLDAGCWDLGESRPQDLWRKAEAIQRPNLRWHLIGHLQRNKARRTVPLVSLIHSGDSLRLLTELNEQASLSGTKLAVLLEVNISGDETKHGFHPAEMDDVFPIANGLGHLQIKGLMTMASREGDLDSARQEFRQLRELRDRLQSTHSEGPRLAELSMGMSGDFEVAIEEGATMVRVGSALFEGLA